MQPVDPSLLTTLLAVVEGGSFSAAANRLGTVQSNVTNRVRKLEDRLGGRLFDRGRGGATLTPLGKAAADRARIALSALDEFERGLVELAGKGAPLRLGAMETTAATRLPSVLGALRERWPETPVSLHTAPTMPLMEMVRARTLDAAFVAGPVEADLFHVTPAFEEKLVALGQQQDGVFTGPLLAFPEGCSYRARAETWLDESNQGHVQVTEMGALDAMLGCAAMGMGFVVVPEVSACRNIHARSLSRVKLPKTYGAVRTVLIRRHDAENLRAFDALVAVLSETEHTHIASNR